MNTVVHGEFPGVLTIAEESTAFPGVSHPVYAGGLGFTHKWNMGWMHDTLAYFEREPVHRRFHHHELTFGLVYAWTENFVLPLSPRRGRAPEGLAAREDAGRRLAAASPTCGRCTAGCGATPAASCCSWAREIAQRQRVEPRPLARLAPARPRRRTPACATCLRELNRLEAGPAGAVAPRPRPRGLRVARRQRRRPLVLRVPAPGSGRRRAGRRRRQPHARAALRLPPRRAPSGRWRVVLNTDDARWWGSGVEPLEGGVVEAEPPCRGTASRRRCASPCRRWRSSGWRPPERGPSTQEGTPGRGTWPSGRAARRRAVGRCRRANPLAYPAAAMALMSCSCAFPAVSTNGPVAIGWSCQGSSEERRHLAAGDRARSGGRSRRRSRQRCRRRPPR